MSRHVAASLVAAVLISSPCPATAQPQVLGLEDALTLARARAPALRAARLRIDEARGRRTGAAALLRDNPIFDAAAGARTAGGRATVELDVGLEQTFELGGGRAARVAAAEAGVEQAVAEADDVSRRLEREVAIVFYRALHAEEQVRLATAAEAVTADIARIAERRGRAGDVAILDVNLGRVALARARSAIAEAEAGRRAVLGELATLLGLPAHEPPAVRGRLEDRARIAATAELLVRAAGRADLRALAAEARAAEADARAGSARRWPDLGAGVRFAREEDANIVLGTLSLTLPIFERGQGQRAEAAARARRLREEQGASRVAIAGGVHTAFEVYRRRSQAAFELAQNALPLLDENEALARRSWEAGQLGLPELLLIRRETLDTRTQYLDRLLDAAIAGVELLSSAGALP